MNRTLLIAALALAYGARAAEHPEHPQAHEHPAEQPQAKPEKGAHEEHPAGHKHGEHPAGHEHPVGSKAWSKQMRKEFNAAVVDFVAGEAKDGAYSVKDEVLGKTWELKLIGVHKKRIVHLGDKGFFACADFKTVGGEKRKLDLDFYATKDAGGWRIDKVLIHKVDGKPRYTYNEKNERVPVR